MSIALRAEQAVALLREAVHTHAPVVFANSLGAEDMVLTDLIARHVPEIGIFSLDTGRLPAETYDLLQQARDRYGIGIEVLFPDAAQVEAYVREHGINGFYQGVDQRRACCAVRKVAPLRRALAGKGAWVTGLRREQAVTRQSLEASAWDADYGLQKYNPLVEWTQAEVWQYLRENDVPVNALHARGFPSIGCAPCTRAIRPGEDVRAGRWWWEQPEHKECGLHWQDGKLVRTGPTETAMN